MYDIKVGDIVCIVGSESIPYAFLGHFGIIKETSNYKSTVLIAQKVRDYGSMSHTALNAELKVVGHVNIDSEVT